MIYDVFPTPVYRSNLGQRITQEQLDYCRKLELIDNEKNKSSKNDNVLSSFYFKNILDFIGKEIWHFAHNVYGYDDSKVQFYITQSWVNITKKNQAHHAHTHSNSIFSGVFYIKVEETDSISFIRREKHYPFVNDIIIPKKDLTEDSEKYAGINFNCNIREGDLLLFESMLPHYYDPIETDERISLSFNTFVKGELGHRDQMTHLFL